ncbi:hypothetical protein Tco_1300944 [Tanacetum coccineum]
MFQHQVMVFFLSNSFEALNVENPVIDEVETAEVVPKSIAGSSFPATSSMLLPFDVQICAEVSCVQVKTQADWMLLYVVPTGRVVVPTGRYIVPAGKVIIIVSTGRLSLVSTGSILSPGRVK